MEAPAPQTALPPLRHDVRSVVRLAAWCAGAGAVAGLLVGGVGGRLVMLMLRLTSPEYVVGIESDDGFEIGVVSFATVNLLGACATLGAVNGAAYALARPFLPARARLPLWALLGGAVGGAVLVEPDGVDFTLLEPLWLAVVSFTVLPGLAALAIAWLAERWLRQPPQRLASRLAVGVAAVPSAVALPVVAPASALVVAVGRVAALRRLAASLGPLVAPLVVVVVTVAAAVDLVRDARAIL